MLFDIYSKNQPGLTHIKRVDMCLDLKLQQNKLSFQQPFNTGSQSFYNSGKKTKYKKTKCKSDKIQKDRRQI